MEEIINRVNNSALEVFDLEDYYPKGEKTEIDLAQWLHEGFILKEKDFREALKSHPWEQYQSHLVAIWCSTEAILPAWAPILVASYVSRHASFVIRGRKSDVDNQFYQTLLPTIDYSKYLNKPVILKGCSKKPVPESAYVLAIQHLQKFAKSIMYGEACSAVPLFKKEK